ncbi:MAG: DUF4139 domain-containing protein, partial [Candidatus Omnitrophica bacterium]|nr:DUF4139 domain-containing protein [Candidatus Omnitrophota bacterium]
FYSNTDKDSFDIQVTYLTRGIIWKCDYVLLLDINDVLADISGWVTLTNNSGTAYKNASLTLVAGDVNQVEQENYMLREDRMMMSKAQSAPQFTEQAFFEYHMYDLGRKTSINNNQMKQVSLLEAQGFSVEKEYKVDFRNTNYHRQRITDEIKAPVEVTVNFINSEKNKLGMPLPKGTVRLYKVDPQGRQQFIGEDSIDHTPKDEKVSIKVGEAFDVVAKKKMIDYKEVAQDTFEVEWEFVINNHKKTPVKVIMFDAIMGQWDVMRSTHRIGKENAFTLRYDLDVPADGEQKVVYRLKIRV